MDMPSWVLTSAQPRYASLSLISSTQTISQLRLTRLGKTPINWIWDHLGEVSLPARPAPLMLSCFRDIGNPMEIDQWQAPQEVTIGRTNQRRDRIPDVIIMGGVYSCQSLHQSLVRRPGWPLLSSAYQMDSHYFKFKFFEVRIWYWNWLTADWQPKLSRSLRNYNEFL